MTIPYILDVIMSCKMYILFKDNKMIWLIDIASWSLTHDTQNNDRVEWFPYCIIDRATCIDGAIVLMLWPNGQNTLGVLQLVLEHVAEVLDDVVGD